jgi:hypothetical protein
MACAIEAIEHSLNGGWVESSIRQSGTTLRMQTEFTVPELTHQQFNDLTNRLSQPKRRWEAIPSAFLPVLI